MTDLDRRASTIVVRLRGAHATSTEFRSPRSSGVCSTCIWNTSVATPLARPAWVGLRRGWPNPLIYSAFEAGLRQLAARTGIEVTAHMFRHTVASGVVATSGVAAAQQLLGHRHIATTVDTYAHVDQQALVAAVTEIERQARAAAENAHRMRSSGQPGRIEGLRYVFHYDSQTLAELEAVATPRHTPGSSSDAAEGPQAVTGLVIQRARQLGAASYDRQVCIENLVAQMRGWRFSKRYDDNRMLYAVHATFDVLDGLEGDSLAERWARFEEQIWPRWQAGIDRPERGTRWGFGAGPW